MKFDFLDSDTDSELLPFCEPAAKFAESNLKSVRNFRREDFDAMGRLGLCGIGVDEEFGGAGIPTIGGAAILFELAKRNLGPAIYLSVHQMVTRLVATHQSNKTHADLLSSLSSGSKLGAFCLTEAAAGSDAAALEMKAKVTASGFELEGEKIYISSAPYADTFLVFARTDPSRDKRLAKEGISCFVVDAKTPGIEVGPEEKKMGCESSPIASIRFSQCKIYKESLLGTLGGGYGIALSGLSRGRISIAACACGIAASALEKSASHLNSRRQFGKALSEFQGLQFIFADMQMLYRASVLLTKDAARQVENGSTDSIAPAMAKCFATDAAMKITTDAVQLLGGAGYLSDYGVEQLMRDAKMLQIVEGTNQIQRLLISRALTR